MKKKSKSAAPSFAVCIDNSNYPAALELNKIYQIFPDARAAEDDYLRVIDESGEDYLYSADRFVVIDLPPRVKRSVTSPPNKSGPDENDARRSPRTKPRAADQSSHRTSAKRLGARD